MKKSGIYTMYNRIEVKLIEIQDKCCTLHSTDHRVLNLGFEKYNEKIFFKQIEKEDIGECFRIDNTAIYKGKEYGFRTFGYQIEIAITDPKIAESLGFERTDKYLYTKLVDLDEVEIIEHRTPYKLN